MDASDWESREHDKVSPDYIAAFKSWKFKTAIATPWKLGSAHINLLETEAFLLAVRHMRRSLATRSSRVAAFIENTAVLGALAKGRSSSSALNRGCRHVIAAGILADVRFDYHWVQSELNPVDLPSRQPHGSTSRRTQGFSCDLIEATLESSEGRDTRRLQQSSRAVRGMGAAESPLG